MNAYEISYRDSDAPKDEFPFGRRVVVGTELAKNGIEAIYALLRRRGVEESDLTEARHVGSIKRVYLFGISFEAKKI